MLRKHVATTVGHVVDDFILTPVRHGSPINDQRLTVDLPSYGVHELSVRKYQDILGGMLCKLIQEGLSSAYEVQERLGACTIRERGV